MQITLGYNSSLLRNNKSTEEAKVIWDTNKLINGHMILVGKSGSGKTFSLRRILKDILQEASKRQQNFRVHVIDVHGDIDIEGASTIKFSESTNYGFNPLIINPDPDFGGVRKRIQSFISSLNRTGFKLGGNQESMLRSLLLDLYAANGIYEKDVNSWNVKNNRRGKNPTIEDLYRFADAKMKSMFLGTNSKCISALTKLNKMQSRLFLRLRQANKANESDIKKIEEDIDKLKADYISTMQDYVDNIGNGKELEELLKYDSLDVMKSLTNKISNLNSIGIFKNESPPFDKTKNIWRYDIKSLDLDEKALFVSFLCEQLFYRAVQRGEQDDILEIIVLDEAHLFINDDSRNPINTIAKEARKFGLALFAASQSPTHFSEDFLSNVSTKIILGIDQTFWNNTINKLKLSQEALEWIIFHKRILIQINNKGDNKNDFIWAYTKPPSFSKQ